MHAATGEQRENFYRELYEKDFPGIHLAGSLELTDDREANVIRVTVPFVTPQFWSGDASTGFRADLPARSVEGLFIRPEPRRQSPLQISSSTS
jgi:hypothetical protein